VKDEVHDCNEKEEICDYNPEFLVATGKYADMILVNGDPTQRISDIRRVVTVIKNGVVYKPAELYPAFGIRPE
jgi:hypothetical protein